MLLNTFTDGARKLLLPFFDKRHKIYESPNLTEVLNEIRDVFCSPIQIQELRNIYLKTFLKANDTKLKVFLAHKMELFCNSKKIFKIPPGKDDPPRSSNTLFRDFLLDFLDSVTQNVELFTDLAKVLPEMNKIEDLSKFISQYENTLNLLKHRSKILESSKNVKK
jgi:hypothetical protein